MPGEIQLGNNYEIDEDGSGDFVITDKNSGNDILRWDDSAGEWIFEAGEPVRIAELIDGSGVSHTGELADLADITSLQHDELNGLADDDHTQYLLVDGTRAMSGALDMGANAISNTTDITASGTTESDTYTVNGSTIAQSVVATGQVTLTDGEATVDTGISAVDATFSLALGVDDPNANVDLSGRLFWDDTAGTYKIDIVEATTNVGNPTANYDVVRVR